jgi:rare lipoprotein A
VAQGATGQTKQVNAEYDAVEWARWPAANSDEPGQIAVWIAHPTLPIPAYVELTRIDTGKTIIARVSARPSDSGGKGAYFELSLGAASQLNLEGEGTAQLRIRRLNPPVSEQEALTQGRPAVARLDTPESLLVILRRKAAQLPPPAPQSAVKPSDPQKNRAMIIRSDRPDSPAAPVAAPKTIAPAPTYGSPWYIQIAALSRQDRAVELARSLGGEVSAGNGFYRVRTGPYATQQAARAALGPIQSKGYPDARLTR